MKESILLAKAKKLLKENGYILKESTISLDDYVDELTALIDADQNITEEIKNSIWSNFENSLYDMCSEWLSIGNDGMYYSKDVGYDSMTDNIYEAIGDGVDYDDVVAEFGTPEEYLANFI